MTEGQIPRVPHTLILTRPQAVSSWAGGLKARTWFGLIKTTSFRSKIYLRTSQQDATRTQPTLVVPPLISLLLLKVSHSSIRLVTKRAIMIKPQKSCGKSTSRITKE